MAIKKFLKDHVVVHFKACSFKLAKTCLESRQYRLRDNVPRNTVVRQCCEKSRSADGL